MFTLVLWVLFISGIIAGRLLRHNASVRRLGGMTMPTVMLLLFIFGAEIGGDSGLMSALPGLGSVAALIAVACVGGSIAMSWLLSRFIKK